MGDKLTDISLIVTAAGAPGAPGIIKSLRLNTERQIRIIATDMNRDSAGLFMADKAYIVPPGKSVEFIPEMLKIAERERVDLILPVATDELMALSKNKKRFEETGTKILVSDPEPLEIANNKGKLFEFLRERSIPTPKSVMVAELAEFSKAVFEMGYPYVPVCVKPPVSRGGRGFRILKEDINKLDMWINSKPDNTFITLADIISVFDGTRPFPELVVMEYLPGDEYSVDLLVENGEPLITVPRRRDAVKLGISFMGTVDDNKEVITMAEAIARVLGLDYNINMQLRYSTDGIPKIIEINPRVSGTIVLGTGAGVNMPYLAVKLALGEKIPQITPKYGTRMIRHWEEIFLDQAGNPFTL